MQRIAINICFGGFCLSPEAIRHYAALKGITLTERENEYNEADFFYPDGNWFSDRELPRDDPHLIETLKALGPEADGFCASLKIVEIPDGVLWKIEGYDGKEHIAETHRTWR